MQQKAASSGTNRPFWFHSGPPPPVTVVGGMCASFRH
uniref:Uncharacterized protein n=1 Tax=Anguilla anguilla TaxID=7936 RepID=A0A0E9RGY2_ANGAN